MSTIEDIEQSFISPLDKGMPPVPALKLAEIGSQRWNVLNQDLSFPVAVIKEEELLQNASWMERFAKEQDIWLYPHGKTTMAPQLFSLQLQHGCRGISAASPLHAEVYLEYGVESVLIANQVVGRQSIRRLGALCERYPRSQFFLIVDSKENARAIHAELGSYVQERRVSLLIEFGALGGRTGVRGVEQTCELAAFLRGLGIAASGLEAFEGVFNPDDTESSAKKVTDLLQQMVDAYKQIGERGLFAPGLTYLSAGGSWFYDLVVDAFNAPEIEPKPQVIVRSGCYISHDSGLFKRAYSSLLERGILNPGDHLQPALEVWAQVQSQPEPGLAFANAGKRDISHDIELPVPEWWYRPGEHETPLNIEGHVRVTALNDQHTYLAFDDQVKLRVGDLIGLGVSHPCTTFDKWKYLFTVDGRYAVTGAVKTYF